MGAAESSPRTIPGELHRRMGDHDRKREHAKLKNPEGGGAACRLFARQHGHSRNTEGSRAETLKHHITKSVAV